MEGLNSAFHLQSIPHFLKKWEEELALGFCHFLVVNVIKKIRSLTD